jgi:hypothetical protein
MRVPPSITLTGSPSQRSFDDLVGLCFLAGRFQMLRHCAHIKLFVALAFISVMLWAGSALGQSPATPPVTSQKDVASRSSNSEVASESKPNKTVNRVPADESRPEDLKSELETLKSENAAVRELLQKMADQQKALLEQVDRLQRRLDGTASTNTQSAGGASGSPQLAEPSLPLTSPTNGPAQPVNSGNASAQQIKPEKEDRYQDGIIIYQNSDEAKVPFLLKFNNNTQVRYLNTLNSPDTFTDHLGNVREVHRRNDITVNRSMFTLTGYMFSKKLQYSLTVWTSAGAASIVVAGNIGYRFSKALTLTGGYTGVPGSRSLVNTFPFFAPVDRSMADNFFRPGFTQGIWASGEPLKGLNYLVFVGNGLNTLNLSANKIDTSLLLSGSVWWEPLGAYSEPGKSRQMYDDYFAVKKVRMRLGTSFTRSREDRFSELDQSNPDNTSIYNSDGVLAFATGAFAPGVTVDKATYRMWAIDGGLKYNGFAINGQYFMRWLNNFEADGPLPLKSTFDHGFEMSAGHFIIPKKLVLYARGSKVFGQFANPYEYGGGFKWYFLPTERVWITGEMLRVNRAPYSGAFTPYTAGMSGWVPMLQSVLAF